MNLKNQLQTYLKAHGLTASQVSRISGVPDATLADWIAGRKPRNFDQVKKVADVFKVTIDHLIYGDGVKGAGAEAVTDLETLLGEGWVGGLFEVRLRRVKRKKE